MNAFQVGEPLSCLKGTTRDTMVIEMHYHHH